MRVRAASTSCAFIGRPPALTFCSSNEEAPCGLTSHTPAPISPATHITTATSARTRNTLLSFTASPRAFRREAVARLRVERVAIASVGPEPAATFGGIPFYRLISARRGRRRRRIALLAVEPL